MTTPVSEIRIDPNKEYGITIDGLTLRPRDDFIGFNFTPDGVILDNLRSYQFIRGLIGRGVISETAPLASNFKSIASEEALIERLRTMVYDITEAITIQQALGGRERFDRVVRMAQSRLYMEQLPPPSFDRTFYEPD